VNRLHLRYCASRHWARTVAESVLPAALDGVDLGDSALEVGPGPGLTTELVRERVPRLRCVELDGALAASLHRRTARTNVDVVRADATRLPFAAGSFSAALSFTMLHHVPSPALQDGLLAELCRVLRPGGVLAGSDSAGATPLFRLIHLFDVLVPIDPATLGGRLERAGFVDPSVRVAGSRFVFRALRP